MLHYLASIFVEQLKEFKINLIKMIYALPSLSHGPK
jgi:hypothetical protein